MGFIKCFVTMLFFVTLQAQDKPESSQMGQCQPTPQMVIRGQTSPLAEGEVMQPNICTDCTCTAEGTFECCLSKTNAGKRFVYPGSICTSCRCADVPFGSMVLSMLGPTIQNHCFTGYSIMTCVSSICTHPLLSDPNCVLVRSERDECCDQCVQSGCYLAWNGRTLSQVDNRLAVSNIKIRGSEMIRVTFGETIRRGCLQGVCRQPTFAFPGGFVLATQTCNSTL
ncbi:uncharacterized protein LOC143468992 [Clavelina lepadiformis]|uniref:Uncharacterized protein n=1 Tax=Clavelina lepadiformis TaxID=159417 RepID=A0ABP0F8I0_CLALP